jgi:hypothetical protein
MYLIITNSLVIIWEMQFMCVQRALYLKLYFRPLFYFQAIFHMYIFRIL